MMVVESREEGGGRSAWTLCSGLPLRRTQARQPRTFPYLLLPSPYLTDSPERASHALFPTFLSLLPSLEAHCIVATHYFLPSTFSPLPSPMDARQNCRAGALERAIHALPSTFFSLLPTLEAHCIVATHYFLPSALFSLLFPCSFHLVQSTWMSP